MSCPLAIKKESIIYQDQVDRINKLAFQGIAEMKLVQDLRSNGDLLLSLIAVYGNDVVGHIAFSRGWIETGQDRIPTVGLGPMAVHPTHQGKGIGSQLIQESLLTLKEMGEQHCFVLGHTWFYPKFGFVPASTFTIDSIYQAGEHFMGQELVPGSLQGIRGRFIYSAAFEGL